MAEFTRFEVIGKMMDSRMVPLFHHPNVKVSKNILKACYEGGARLLEFTARGDFAFEVFAELSKYATSELPGMILGVGSITDASAASTFMQMGANFVVTPSLREDVAVTCNRRKVLYAPGCGSLTEINRAEEMGVEIIKLFPGSTYGPDFVKAIKGPQPWTSIMPTGGVTLDESNLRKWFGAGVTCVGIGSKLITKEIVEKELYGNLEKNVAKVLATIKSIKS